MSERCGLVRCLSPEGHTSADHIGWERAAASAGADPTYRGGAADRLAERDRFLREHGDHGLRRFEGDEEFGYFDGFACDVHEVEIQLIPTAASAGADPEPPPIEKIVADMPWPASCRHCNLVTEDPDAYFWPTAEDMEEMDDWLWCPSSPSHVHEARTLVDYGYLGYRYSEARAQGGPSLDVAALANDLDRAMEQLIAALPYRYADGHYSMVLRDDAARRLAEWFVARLSVGEPRPEDDAP